MTHTRGAAAVGASDRADDYAGAARWRMLALLSGAMLMSLSAWMTATVVADSAQFSALITEVAPADAVGTALMVQTSMDSVDHGDHPGTPLACRLRGVAVGVRLPRLRPCCRDREHKAAGVGTRTPQA